MDNKNTIGIRINTSLALRGIKQKELAAHLNVPDNTISYFCSGKRTPNVVQIIEMSKILNVSTDYLLGLSNVPTTNNATKELCATLGLSDIAVSYLHSPSNQTIRDVVNFLFEQHDNIKSRTFVPDLEQSRRQGLQKNKDIFSLLENLSLFLSLCDANEDIEICLEDGEVGFIKYTTKEMIYKSCGDINISTNIDTGASLVSLGKDQCIHRINSILNDLSLDAFVRFNEKVIGPHCVRKDATNENP